jgi:hypothetical protein
LPPFFSCQLLDRRQDLANLGRLGLAAVVVDIHSRVTVSQHFLHPMSVALLLGLTEVVIADLRQVLEQHCARVARQLP